MLFNSFQFALFFPVVTIIYYLLPHKFRWFHLLIASCLFYMAFIPVYILILLCTIVIDYIAGIVIENANGSRRKWFLVISIISNVGLLAFFKYYNFFADNFNALLHLSNVNTNIPLLKIILPLGLSFHTFQAMSYTIEVYRGNQKAEKHFGIYALYVMFYPQLVAGPIERPQNMLHQFHERHKFEYDNVAAGSRLILWGLFKKVVIADRLALIVDPVFNNPRQYSGIMLVIALFLFAYEIYCDFSGYSEMALGTARVMGFNLMVNFNHPFSSKSATEFWRRWHISLSTWFYDYVFNPLVLTLRNWGKAAVAFGLFITFLLSGFWHGAGWTYIIWGILNGTSLVYEYFTKKQRKNVFSKLPQPINNGLSKLCTFSFMCFGWIFFRAKNLRDAFYIVKKIPHSAIEFIYIRKYMKIPHAISYDIPLSSVIVCIFWIALLEYIHKIKGGKTVDVFLHEKPLAMKFFVYGLLLYSILLFGVFGDKEFIYFQF